MYFQHKTLLLTILIYLSPVLALAAASPLDQTKAFIAALAAAEKNNDKSYSSIDSFINYDRITSEAIKPHLNQFTEKQATTVKQLLKKIIRMVAFPKSAEFYKSAKYTLSEAVVKDDASVVQLVAARVARLLVTA